jgi:hypothetical protein
MDTKETVVGVIALVSAFAGGDFLDVIEPTTHTHVIDEQCTVTRQIEKEL